MADAPSLDTLVDPDWVHRHLDDPSIALLDARYNLMDAEEGPKAYLDGHVPGAVYVHLYEDLSGPPVTDEGRHPLPTPEALEATFSRLGIDRDTQVVVYDQRDGSVAARVWWLLRYMGHDAVAVMDGGWQAWCAAGHPVRSGRETRPQARFRGTPRPWVVRAEEVLGAPRLVDARDPRRFRGEHEPLDPVAGHIPGAVNHFHRRNVDDDGRFLPRAELRERLEETLAGTPAGEAVFYCGSGVSACHNLLALARAGLPLARLYAGSWSDWIRDPARPVARGN